MELWNDKMHNKCIKVVNIYQQCLNDCYTVSYLYHWLIVCNKSNTMGASYGAGTANSSETAEFSFGF
jgi:hypothetical protein